MYEPVTMSNRADQYSRKAAPIAFILPRLISGGAQRVFVTLANALVDITEHPIHLIVIRDGGELWEGVRPEVKVINLESYRLRRSILPLVRYIKNERPHAIYATLTYCNFVAVIAKSMSFVRCSLVLREATIMRKQQIVKRFLVAIFYPFADFIVVLSPEMKTALINPEVIFASKIRVLNNPLCVRAGNENGSNKTRLILQHLGRFICAVGSLKYAKGFDILIDAFAQLRHPSLNLVLLGEGPLRQSLEKQAKKLNVADRVFMPGYVSDPSRVVEEASLFVLSSRWEGFPNVLVEALRTGVPIVATDCPGAVRSILKDGQFGDIVAPQNSKALAQGIARRLGNPRRGHEARIKRSFNFAPDSVARKYLEIIS